MTRKEFSENSEAVERIMNRVMPGFLIVMFFLTILSAYIERRYHNWDTPVGILICFIAVGGLIGVTLFERRLLLERRLLCPKCSKRFINNKERWLILFRGNCPKCQSKVFDAATTANPAAPHGADLEKFKIEFESLTRRLRRKAILSFIFLFIATLSIAPLAKYFQHLVEHGDFDWVTLTQLRWFAVIMLATVFLSFVSIFIFASMGKFKVRDLPCPECGRSLVGGAGRVAIESGMCMYCGGAVFKARLREGLIGIFSSITRFVGLGGLG